LDKFYSSSFSIFFFVSKNGKRKWLKKWEKWKRRKISLVHKNEIGKNERNENEIRQINVKLFIFVYSRDDNNDVGVK
jgi:hypothetical protein